MVASGPLGHVNKQHLLNFECSVLSWRPFRFRLCDLQMLRRCHRIRTSARIKAASHGKSIQGSILTDASAKDSLMQYVQLDNTFSLEILTHSL